MPVGAAIPCPIRLGDNLLLCSDECGERAHAVFVLWASFDTGERGDTVVDDDTDLSIGETITGKDCNEV